jgi:AraC-like DNA-binding protein
MQKARMAIVAGRDAIGQIARKAGYRSEAAFGRAFKQTFGITPASLRRAG